MDAILTIENKVQSNVLDPVYFSVYQQESEGVVETLVWKTASAESGGKILLTIPTDFHCTASVFPSKGVELRSKEIELKKGEQYYVGKCKDPSEAPFLSKDESASQAIDSDCAVIVNKYTSSREVLVAVRKNDSVLMQKRLRTRDEHAKFRVSQSMTVAHHSSPDLKEGSPVPTDSADSGSSISVSLGSVRGVIVSSVENQIRWEPVAQVKHALAVGRFHRSVTPVSDAPSGAVSDID